eukprot:m51a1_g6877 hypothetical protein (459) ;mRNA; f:201633-206233
MPSRIMSALLSAVAALLASVAVAQLPTPPEQWYLRLEGTVPYTREENATLREAWQTRWRSVDRMYTPEVWLGDVYKLRNATRTTTWTDRARSLSASWQRDYVHARWSAPNYTFPLAVFATPLVSWAPNGTAADPACGAAGCDTYLSSVDEANSGSSYRAYYAAGTNVPVQMVVMPGLFGPEMWFTMRVVDWRVGGAVPADPAVDAGAPRYPPLPVCARHADQASCSSVLSSFCAWCSDKRACTESDSANCTLPRCSEYATAGECPSGRCSWCEGSIGCSQAACPVCADRRTDSACTAASGACRWCEGASVCVRSSSQCPVPAALSSSVSSAGPIAVDSRSATPMRPGSQASGGSVPRAVAAMGVALASIDPYARDNHRSSGWYLYCHNRKLYLGQPQALANAAVPAWGDDARLLAQGFRVVVKVDVARGSVSFECEGRRAVIEGVPVQQPLVPAVLLS